MAAKNGPVTEAKSPRASLSAALPRHPSTRSGDAMPAFRRPALLLPAALLLTSGFAFAAPPAAAPPVTVTDDGPTYTMSNGYLTVQVNKKTGDLTSVKTTKTVTPKVELMGYVSGHHAGYWEQSPDLAPRREDKITIDPASNGGARDQG